MHVFGGLQRPDSGSVRIDDQDVTQLDDAELASVRADKVGFLFQAFKSCPMKQCWEMWTSPFRNRACQPRKAAGRRWRFLRLWAWEIVWSTLQASFQRDIGSTWPSPGHW